MPEQSAAEKAYEEHFGPLPKFSYTNASQTVRQRVRWYTKRTGFIAGHAVAEVPLLARIEHALKIISVDTATSPEGIRYIGGTVLQALCAALAEQEALDA